MFNSSRAHYRWPCGHEFEVLPFGNKPASLVVGCLPHPNEPLGSAFLSCFSKQHQKESFLVIDNIDPPPTQFRYPLPCEFFSYLSLFHLPQITHQVEFSHANFSHTTSQKRAQMFRELLIQNQVKFLLLIHNDPFADLPYFYANKKYPVQEETLREAARRFFPVQPIPEVPHTSRLSEIAYAYFPANRIEEKIETEATGIFIPRELGIEVLTLECPMFSWKNVPEEDKTCLYEMHDHFWMNEISITERKEMIKKELPPRLRKKTIPMIPANHNAYIQLAVICSLLFR